MAFRSRLISKVHGIYQNFLIAQKMARQRVIICAIGGKFSQNETTQDIHNRTEQQLGDGDYRLAQFTDKKKLINQRFVIDLNENTPPEEEKSQCHGNIGPNEHPHACINFHPIATQSVLSRFYGSLRTLVPAANWKAYSLVPTIEKDGNLPSGPFYISTRGMKYKGKAKRRCKNCFLMWVNGMLYNLCKTHPRHKHGMKLPYYSNQRLLTHATMSPKRPW